MQKQLLIIGLLIGFACCAFAQEPVMPVKKTRADSIQAKHDSLKSKPFVPKITSEKVYHPDSNHSPHKAVMHSLMIPGWGQAYNRQWWKIPVIYTGLTLLVVYYKFNQSNYKEFLTIAQYRERGDAPKPGQPYYQEFQDYQFAPDASVTDAVRAYRRYRDLGVFGFVAAWGIQTIDAYIDAKFMHSYSMDNNFTFKVSPGIINQPVYAGEMNGTIIPGLKFTFTLR